MSVQTPQPRLIDPASVPALLADPDIDVVDVATPHPPLHREQALQAIAAGKHVLIEKPIAMSADEAREILAAGRATGVLVAEAMWTRHLPHADVIRQVLESGVLGEVSLVRADFGFVAPEMPEHRLWNPELGGGAMLDAGVYPVSFASSVLGAPSVVRAIGTVAETGVDSSANVLLATPSGAEAVLSTSLVASLPVEASIHGSLGRLEVLSPFFGPSGIRLVHAPGSPEEEAFLADARATLSAIPGTADFAINRQVSAKSAFAWQFTMRFADEAVYAVYDEHPAHVAFVRDRWATEVEAFEELDFVRA